MSGAWVVGSELTPSLLGLAEKAALLTSGSGCRPDMVLIKARLDKQDISLLSDTGRMFHLPLDCCEPDNVKAASETLAALWQREKPEFILFESSIFFCDLAPDLAARLGCGITADCTSLDRDEEGRLLQIRPAFGGRKLASNISLGETAIATVRKGVFHKALAPSRAKAEIIPLNSTKADNHWVLSRRFTEAVQTQALCSADIVLSGGLGMGSEKNFRRLYTLAGLMGASVGASRAAVAAGYAGYNRQLGQTGLSVRPRLYIAFGISGAVQHLCGISGANKIIAVNQDPRAPIHDYSDFSLLSDCNEIVELLIKRLESGSAL